MWVVVPVKRFVRGKSRLASVLSVPQRRELTRCMLRDVIHALRLSRCVEKVVVLSNESGIDDVLGDSRIDRIAEDSEGDLNRSLMTAATAMPARVGRLLIVPSDVPAICPHDIEVLSEAHAKAIVLSPAVVDGGTNALLSPLPLPIALQFGKRSLRGHLAAAWDRGIPTRVVPRPGLARDIDRAPDLSWFARSSRPGYTSSYLREICPPDAADARADFRGLEQQL